MFARVDKHQLEAQFAFTPFRVCPVNRFHEKVQTVGFIPDFHRLLNFKLVFVRQEKIVH